MCVHTHDAHWIRRTYLRTSVDETDVVATRMLCLPGRAGACTIRAAMNGLSTSRPHATGTTGTLWDMSWHVTAQLSAELSKSRCLGNSWQALAYLIDPSLPSKPLHHFSIESPFTSCPSNFHPSNSHIANMSCFKKADTRTACRCALFRQPSSAHSARGPLRVLLCNPTARKKDLLVDTP